LGEFSVKRGEVEVVEIESGAKATQKSAHGN